MWYLYIMENVKIYENLNIKTVCKLTGITEFVLRAWEKRYHVVDPTRLPNGHRAYSLKEVEKLRQIKQLVDQGRAISKVAKIPEDELSRLVPVVKPSLAHILPSGSTDSEFGAGSLPQHVEGAFRALKRFDLDKVSAHLLWGRTHVAAQNFMFDMVIPLVWRIGENVARKEMSISQEHAFSVMLKGHLSEVYRIVQSEREPQKDRLTIAISGPEGDKHDFCLTSAAILAAARGYDVIYLGSDLPVSEFVRTANQVKADVVLFGTSRLPVESLVRTHESSLTYLALNLSQSCEIWAGGPTPIDVAAVTAETKKPIRQIRTLDHFDECLLMRVTFKHGDHVQQLS
jgi:DNA-binding transcriptional MerR regulator